MRVAIAFSDGLVQKKTEHATSYATEEVQREEGRIADEGHDRGRNEVEGDQIEKDMS